MSIMGLGAGVATLLTLVGVAMAIPIARDADAQALSDCSYVRSYDHNGDTAIDIIDFSYRHWHRLSDVPENCSGDSLAQVAKVLSVWLQRVR